MAICNRLDSIPQEISFVVKRVEGNFAQSFDDNLMIFRTQLGHFFPHRGFIEQLFAVGFMMKRLLYTFLNALGTLFDATVEFYAVKFRSQAHHLF